MAWFIDPDINNGYPWNDSFPQTFRTDFIDNGTVRLPYYAWRIKAGVNNGYPWIYYWFKEDTPTGGDMIIGGSQTNYPNGFTSANRGGIKNDFDDVDMRIGNTGGNYATSTLAGAMSGRAFIIDYPTFLSIISKFNDDTIFTTATYAAIANLYGANVFNSVLSAETVVM